jgi:hypothetical protein
VNRSDVVMLADLGSQPTRPYLRLIEPHDLMPATFIGEQSCSRDQIVVGCNPWLQYRRNGCGTRRSGRPRWHDTSVGPNWHPAKRGGNVGGLQWEDSTEANCDDCECCKQSLPWQQRRQYSKATRHRGDPFAGLPLFQGGIGAVAPLTACDYGSRQRVGQKHRSPAPCFLVVCRSGHPG